MVIFGVQDKEQKRKVEAAKTERQPEESKGQETSRDIVSKSG